MLLPTPKSFARLRGALLPALVLGAGLVACSDRPAPAADSVPVLAGGGASDTAGGAVAPTFGDTALRPGTGAATGKVPTVPAPVGVTPPGAPTAGGPGATPGPAGTPTPPASTAATPGATGSAVPGSSATTPAQAQAGATQSPTPGQLVPGAPAAPAVTTPVVPAAPRRASVPWAPGERLTYDVKFGALDVGDATMEVRGIEQVRGEEAYHTVFRVSGGTMFFKVNDRYESWIDVSELVSLRHHQQIDEGTYERERRYEIHPGRTYKENDKPEQPTVAKPLDDGSFFYFVRTLPLEVGQTYTFHHYFRPDRNPVTIRVLRKERIRVPAGTFNAIVIQPQIKTKGVFGEGGRAAIWLADDSTRAMLQMKSDLKFGSLNLYLKRLEMGRRPGG